jgi:hypothetical protein
MYIFHYFDHNDVQVGDLVIGPERRIGRVSEIIQPGSYDAECFGIPEGGVRFIFDWNGVHGAELMTPPDGEYWEDIEFVCREKCISGLYL